MRFLRFTILALLALLILSACGAAPTTTTTPATATIAAATTVATPNAAASSGSGTPDQLQKIRLALDWTPNTNHIGFYVALANNWYKDVGIDLEILPYSDANTPDALVAAKQADFGIGFMESLAYDYVTKLPIKSVAAIGQHNTSALVTLKSSGLDRPAQLEGKKYAGFGAPYEEPMISTMIKNDGGQTGQFQNITANLSGYQALSSKQVDFVWIYMGWEGIQAKHDNVDLNAFYIKDYGVPDYYTPLIIGNTDFLKNNADLAKRFMAATAKGFQYAIDNPDQAADLLIKQNTPDTFPDTSLVHESAQFLAPVFKGEVSRWGEQNEQMIEGYTKFMLNTKTLLDANNQPFTGQINYQDLYTNDYLP